MTVSNHLARYPNARTSTIAQKEREARKLAQLRAELTPAKAEQVPVAVPAVLLPIEQVLGNDVALVIRVDALREYLGWSAKAAGVQVQEIA